MNEYYDRLLANVNENADWLMACVKDLYEHPEIGDQEFRTMGVLSRMLKEKGFEVETQFIRPTGFIGRYDSGKPGPLIAFLCEYDALPEIGHGCGHNMIANIGIGAGCALKSIIDEIGGRLWVVGTPAEENMGGKVYMAEAGVFDEVDAAMMIHPSTYNGLGKRTVAINPVKFEFHGKTAHGCRPENGASALDAAVLTYMNINMLRQFVKRGTFIHGIFRDGGAAANVIPDYASLEYYFRGNPMSYVLDLTERAKKCAEGACLGTGTTVTTSIYEMPYDDFNINYGLAELLNTSYEIAGVEDIRPVDETPQGSSDIGAVSYRCPALHGYIKIAGPEVNGHSRELAAATISPLGREALIKAASALANVGATLILEPETLKKVKDEFISSLSSK